MREIKFRGLNTNSKEWKYGYLVVDEKYTQIWQRGDVPVIVDPKTVGQYIGLKDKNGKEIYEGDVLADIYVVEWDRGALKYILTCPEDGYYCMELNELTWEDTVIIGNIHENPELLEEK